MHTKLVKKYLELTKPDQDLNTKNKAVFHQRYYAF